MWQGFDIRLEIDGGVTVDNIQSVAEAGVDMFVAGSAILKEPREQVPPDPSYLSLFPSLPLRRLARCSVLQHPVAEVRAEEGTCGGGAGSSLAHPLAACAPGRLLTRVCVRARVQAAYKKTIDSMRENLAKAKVAK